MRVLHVIARLNVGGTARYITRLAQELPKNGIETFIAAGHVQGAEQEDPSARDINVIRIPSLGRSFNPIKDHFAHKELVKIVGEVKPDIIHTHTFKAGFIGRSRIKDLNYAAGKKLKFVHTFHGHLFDDPEFSGIKSQVITAFERRFAMRTNTLVTVGHQVSVELLEREIGNDDQYVNIPPGVDPLKIPSRSKARENLGLTGDAKLTVGWIARVTGVKNPLRALEVAKAVPEAHFLLAGGGDLLESVRAQAPGNVEVLGWTNAADLFGASDLVLSTSENEGMPIALIEAQIAGIPVVATNVGSVAEVIEDGVTGFVTKKSVDQIALALRTLIDSQDMRARMSKAATERASEIFSVDSMIAAHVRLYTSLIN